MTEMIVAAFDSPSAAEAAVQDLENARIPSADIKSYTQDEPTYQEYRTRQPEHQGGFWSWLIGEDPPRRSNTGPMTQASRPGIPLSPLRSMKCTLMPPWAF